MAAAEESEPTTLPADGATSGPSVEHVEPSQSQDEADMNMSDLCRTKEWLETKQLEHQTALLAAQNKEKPPSDDPEQTLDRILTLQKELQETSTNHSIKELIIHRLQQGQAMTKQLFRPENASGGGDSQAMEECKQALLGLVNKQTELVSAVLNVNKDMQSMRPRLEKLKKENEDLRTHNRELMGAIKDIMEARNAQSDQSQSSDKVKRAQQKVETAIAKVLVQRNIFQGLILGSGVNWAQYPEIQQLLISLGQPVESVLD